MHHCNRRSNCTIPKTNYWYDKKWKYWKDRVRERRFVHLSGFGLKKFAENLIAGIRELWIVEKSFCDDKKTNQLKECKLYHDSGILTIENDTFSEGHDIVCTSNRKMIVITRKLS